MENQLAGSAATERRSPNRAAADHERARFPRLARRALTRRPTESAILLLVALFAALSLCIAPVDHALALDLALHQALIDHSPRGFRMIMRLGHALSDLAVLLGPLLVAWLVIRRRIRLAVVVLASEAGVYIMHLVLKGIFQRARPGDIFPPDAPPSVYLFPSGHTVAAIVIVGLAAYLIAEGRPRSIQRLIAAGATLFIALAGTSLVYFGNHYATDVVGGLLIGGAWLLGTIRLALFIEAPARTPASGQH